MRTLFCILFFVAPSFVFAVELPEMPSAFLQTHCIDCHNGETQQAEISLESSDVDWSDKGTLALWERILRVVQTGEMPPPDVAELTEAERAVMVEWMDTVLTRHSPIGGTLARRLNQSEYQASVESLFGLRGFSLPHGFPVDREHHGFDNLGEGLVLSPPLLESYTETAALVADLGVSTCPASTVRGGSTRTRGGPCHQLLVGQAGRWCTTARHEVRSDHAKLHLA